MSINPLIIGLPSKGRLKEQVEVWRKTAQDVGIVPD